MDDFLTNLMEGIKYLKKLKKTSTPQLERMEGYIGLEPQEGKPFERGKPNAYTWEDFIKDWASTNKAPAWVKNYSDIMNLNKIKEGEMKPAGWIGAIAKVISLIK